MEIHIEQQLVVAQEGLDALAPATEINAFQIMKLAYQANLPPNVTDGLPDLSKQFFDGQREALWQRIMSARNMNEAIQSRAAIVQAIDELRDLIQIERNAIEQVAGPIGDAEGFVGGYDDTAPPRARFLVMKQDYDLRLANGTVAAQVDAWLGECTWIDEHTVAREVDVESELGSGTALPEGHWPLYMDDVHQAANVAEKALFRLLTDEQPDWIEDKPLERLASVFDRALNAHLNTHGWTAADEEALSGLLGKMVAQSGEEHQERRQEIVDEELEELAQQAQQAQQAAAQQAVLLARPQIGGDFQAPTWKMVPAPHGFQCPNGYTIASAGGTNVFFQPNKDVCLKHLVEYLDQEEQGGRAHGGPQALAYLNDMKTAFRQASELDIASDGTKIRKGNWEFLFKSGAGGRICYHVVPKAGLFHT